MRRSSALTMTSGIGRRAARWCVRRPSCDVREGRKHNVQLGFASQRLSDMGDGIIAQSTGRFVLGADDQREREEIVKRFGLTEASAKIVRNRLTGPRRDGAPFLAIFRAERGELRAVPGQLARTDRTLGAVDHARRHQPA